MSPTAEKRLERILAVGPPSGAFFLHGDAARLRDEAARRLVDAALDPATRDFNLDVHRGPDATAESLASSLSMPPVMAARRVVLVREAEHLAPSACTIVEDALPGLPADITLVVTATVPAKSRKKFWKRLASAATSLEFAAPREADVPGWLIERAADAHGVELPAEAAEALASAVGREPDLLDAELAKLAAAARDGRVQLEDVRALVPDVRDVNRWSWLDAVVGREYRTARRQLAALLAAPGESAVGLLIGLVEAHLHVGIVLAGGTRRAVAELERNGKPYLKFKVRTWAAQARRWSPPDLERALELLLEADRQAKTGHGDAAVLDGLLLRLEALGRRAA
ncbi:MAG: DNA polymerase III subunit delta [Gemmatimonadota bacterium]|nr:DNA polymerase III subunit delta [Gemmatimonadota bacterium]